MKAGADLIELIEASDFADHIGRITSIGQRRLDATGPLCCVGDMCLLGDREDGPLAEVVAVDRDGIRLLPLGPVDGLRPGACVRRSDRLSAMRCGDAFAGRAVDAFGEPIDGGGPVVGDTNSRSLQGEAHTLSKIVRTERVATGLRAIDALLPIGQGQRIGIFAASGVGKTTLVEQLSSHVACDHVVLCLIGERGREVERMWRLHSQGERKDKVTLVAATSDESASARVRAMEQALALCEYWRARGKHAVLFVDSITRLAMALREIGLAAGEPPSVRSYTPNVFAALPGFVERCGALKDGGAITAILTVLSETDDVDDPIVETMKSILDGHVVLSRKLAEKGHFPAIDIAASVSRLTDQLLAGPSLEAARALRRAFAEFEESRAMIDSGIYQPGTNEAIDSAIALQPRIADFLRQAKPDSSDPAATDAKLVECVARRAAA